MVVVNGNRQVEWHPGLTVKEVLDALGWDYALITVTVDGRFVPADDYTSFPIPDAADVRVIHIAHGG